MAILVKFLLVAQEGAENFCMLLSIGLNAAGRPGKSFAVFSQLKTLTVLHCYPGRGRQADKP